MRHYVMHRVERLVARLARLVLERVYPETRVLLLDGRTHVAEERRRAVMARQRHVIQRTCRAQRVRRVEVVHGVEVAGVRRRHSVEVVVTRVEAAVGAETQLPGGGGGAVLRALVQTRKRHLPVRTARRIGTVSCPQQSQVAASVSGHVRGHRVAIGLHTEVTLTGIGHVVWWTQF